MKITIDPFDKKTMDTAIKTLEQYKKEFLEKEAEFIRRLKELGVSVAEAGFATAAYDGVNDVLIAETQRGNRAAVIAYGETVGFIEFGTGIRNREWVDDNNVSGKPYKPPKHGTYGDGHGKQPYGWWFNPSDGGKAIHTYGNPPAEAMLTARNAMVEQITTIAQEVWQ